MNLSNLLEEYCRFCFAGGQPEVLKVLLRLTTSDSGIKM